VPSGYQVVAQKFDNYPDFTRATVNCPAGKVVIGGGAEAQGGSAWGTDALEAFADTMGGRTLKRTIVPASRAAVADVCSSRRAIGLRQRRFVAFIACTTTVLPGVPPSTLRLVLFRAADQG
jgi:hypothetical protein